MKSLISSFPTEEQLNRNMDVTHDTRGFRASKQSINFLAKCAQSENLLCKTILQRALSV